MTEERLEHYILREAAGLVSEPRAGDLTAD
jgi:hypothetical protein